MAGDVLFSQKLGLREAKRRKKIKNKKTKQKKNITST